jgi:hypothetical protein
MQTRSPFGIFHRHTIVIEICSTGKSSPRRSAANEVFKVRVLKHTIIAFRQISPDWDGTQTIYVGKYQTASFVLSVILSFDEKHSDAQITMSSMIDSELWVLVYIRDVWTHCLSYADSALSCLLQCLLPRARICLVRCRKKMHSFSSVTDGI